VQHGRRPGGPGGARPLGPPPSSHRLTRRFAAARRGYAAATSATGDLRGAAASLGASIDALDAVVGHAAIGVVVFDVAGRYLYLNETAASFSGISAEEHLGRSIADVAPEAAALLGPLLARVADGEVVTDIEVSGAGADGRVRTSLGSLIPYHDPRGEVSAVVALFWELTDRLEAEEARRAIDARFRLLADAAPVLMWTMDAEGRCDWLSGGWAAYVGRPIEEQLGPGWLSSVHPDDAAGAVAAMREAFGRREPFDVELRIRRRDGAHRWVLDRGVPRFDPTGAFIGYVGTCTDIHERRVAQNRMAALQVVTEAFARTMTQDDVAEAVVVHAVDALGASAGSLCLVDDEGGVRVARAVGYAPRVLVDLGTFHVDDDLPLAEAIRDGRPVLVDDLPRLAPDVWPVFQREVQSSGRKAVAALPITVDGEVVGALGLSFDEPRRFDEAERDFLSAVAAQCSGAMERAALYAAEQAAREAAERSRERLAFLAEAGRVLAGRLSREEILHRITELAVQRMAAVVTLYVEQDGMLRRVTFACDPAVEPSVGDLAPDAIPVVSDDAVSRAYRSGRPILLDVIGDDLLAGLAPEVADAARRSGLCSTVFVPVGGRTTSHGVLCLARFRPATPFGERDLAVATEIASRVGLAVENADLYEQEHRIAETLQRAVLPSRLPDVPGAEVAARYLPASAGVEVGGDWYDAFDLRDGRVGIVVGDVAGHGLRAAAVMGQLRNALRAYAVDGDDPHVVVDRLGRLLQEERDAPFATAIYGVYDPATGDLVLSNAGHPAPLLVTRRGVAPLGEATAPPLGVSASPPGPDVRVRLEPDDLLVLYTDGLVERRTEHLDAGVARLVRCLAAQRPDLPGAAVCDTVVRDVLRGAVQEDDVCVLALRRTEPRH